jgi:hypothetical protein
MIPGISKIEISADGKAWKAIPINSISTVYLPPSFDDLKFRARNKREYVPVPYFPSFTPREVVLRIVKLYRFVNRLKRRWPRMV